MKWLPWRSLARRIALGHGFIDPFALMARMQRFAQPSEVAEPIELLRAGAVMHARGLINSRVIQNNLDWVWPYWVCRQVDPADPAFLPRAFSITQINLTHRNWTAVGLPDCDEMPIVDPRGLVTPFLDGWSLDAWVLTDDGRRLFPSRTLAARQQLKLDPLRMLTETAQDGVSLASTVEAQAPGGVPHCQIRYEARSDQPGWLMVALRPFNPEGVSFIDEITFDPDASAWTVDGRERAIALDPAPQQHHVSRYQHGDVSTRIAQVEAPDEMSVTCESGMATAAAGYRIEEDKRTIDVRVPLSAEPGTSPGSESYAWDHALATQAQLDIPDSRLKFLYDAACRTLVILSPHDAYPGPSTYRRFWFRDAAFMINALACAGFTDRARRGLEKFPERQDKAGYFLSQNGEWDSNGQALWIMHRYLELTGESAPAAWRKPVLKGARWIARKRMDKGRDVPHAGLLPAGFSAEHLGPNDHYYWDDFWAIEGLLAAAKLARELDTETTSAEFEAEAEDLERALGASLQRTERQFGRPAMPASPYRRLDAGAIGSIVAGYPLSVMSPEDPRLLDTARFLIDHSFVQGGFFQDIIHSGINAYLTLHIAQVLMRAGEPEHRELIDAVADLATETGQWPEAVHPRTLGGCMGDGQHGWAAAEWVMMLRNSFLREEAQTLVLGSGVRQEWLDCDKPIRFGPGPTSFGDVTVRFQRQGKEVHVEWEGAWRHKPLRIEVAIPGLPKIQTTPDMSRVQLPMEKEETRDQIA